MPLDDIRERNKEKVVKIALEEFMLTGIEKTKVSDIAKKAELTERSVFRYYETKADLVLACALSFWHQTTFNSQMAWQNLDKQNLSGLMQVEKVIQAYSQQFFMNKQQFIFIQEAEIYLYRQNLLEHFKQKPIEPLKSGHGPLSCAILNGIQDGSIKDKPELEYIYFNIYDGLLGLMQKMATSIYEEDDSQIMHQNRLDCYCAMCIQSLIQ